MSWTANDERYQAEYRGETIYDAPEARDDETAPAPSSAAPARALSHRVFVNSDGLSLGQFMDWLDDYGTARVREARRAA